MEKQSSSIVFIHTNLYINLSQWDKSSSETINHPNEEELYRLLQEELIKLEWLKLKCWRKGKSITLQELVKMAKDDIHSSIKFIYFCKEHTSLCNKKESTKSNLMSTVKLIEKSNIEISIRAIGRYTSRKSSYATPFRSLP